MNKHNRTRMVYVYHVGNGSCWHTSCCPQPRPTGSARLSGLAVSTSSQSSCSIACEVALGYSSSAGSYAQVEYTVYRDQEGNVVDEEHPSASAIR